MRVKFEGKPTIQQYVIALSIFLLIFSSVSQYNRNLGLKQQKKENDIEIESLKQSNKDLDLYIKTVKKLKDSAYKVIDSISTKEKYFKNRYYAKTKELNKIINNYNNLSSDDKHKLLTKELSN